jgi:hypothetical protein
MQHRMPATIDVSLPLIVAHDLNQMTSPKNIIAVELGVLCSPAPEPALSAPVFQGDRVEGLARSASPGGQP